MIWTLLCALASGPATDRGGAAEYQRLSEEMVRMAKVGNWSAVERSFVRLEGLERPHTRKVLLNAAQAAREVGDISLARERLVAAAGLGEDDEAIEAMLWAIQEEYVQVLVAADLPANYRLVPEAMPFVPEHRRAVQFAVDQVRERSVFQGLLPRGRYRFQPYRPQPGDHVFDIDLRRDRQSVDLRTRDEPTRRDRRRRARIDRRVAREERADSSE